MQCSYAMFLVLCICGIKISVYVQFRLSAQSSGGKIHPVLHLYLKIASGKRVRFDSIHFPYCQLGTFPWKSHTGETARAGNLGT